MTTDLEANMSKLERAVRGAELAGLDLWINLYFARHHKMPSAHEILSRIDVRLKELA